MNCFLLITSRDKGASYISDFAEKKGISDVHIATFSEKIVVDTVRSIRRTLSFKPRENERKIVILNNEMTVEAQNALLKCLEELSDHTTIFIVSQRNEYVLPTIISRCSVVALQQEAFPSSEKVGLNEGVWNLIDSLEEGKLSSEEQLANITGRLRSTLLSVDSDEKEKRFAYEALKKLLKLSPLVLNNNVQLRIVIEKILLENLSFLSRNHEHI